MNEPRMTGSDPVVPRGLAERAREISDGRLAPAVPRDAATVILLRKAGAEGAEGAEAEAGVEAFLLRRTAELEFAPGAYVFPGGSVDARDAEPGVGWAGPGPADFAALLDVSPDRARALVCAAVRETFEESGVLLAGPSEHELVRDSVALAADRHALLAGSTSLAEMLLRRGLILRTDLLTPWARWITPEVSPRRCRPGRRPRRRRRASGITRIPGNPNREPGCGPRRRWRRPGPARSRCYLRPR